MQDPVSPGQTATRRSGAWTVAALIVVGLIPFVVSLAWVIYTRREAAKDPRAQKWIDEHAGRTKTVGSGAK